MDHREMFEALQRAEGVTVKYKDESRLMKLLGFLMFYCQDFSTQVITTLGETVYFPSRKFVEARPETSWMILAHELVHVEDYRKNRPLFVLGYLMPQLLALLACLAPWFGAWWLLALAFLAPWPAPWRLNSELRGYAMTMAVWHWYRSGIPQWLKSDIVGHLHGPTYYLAWPFRQHLTQEVGRWTKRVLCNEMAQYGDVFVRVHSMVESRTKRTEGRSG